MADHDAFFTLARRLARAGRPFATATVVRVDSPTSGRPGDRSVVTVEGELHGWIGGSCARPTVIREALAALGDGESRLIRLSSESDETVAREGLIDLSMTCFSGGTMEIFIEPHLPSPSLFVVGEQPVAQALAALGRKMGYRVVAVASAGLVEADERLERIEQLAENLAPLSFVVVATHGESDEIDVETALRASAPYVGLVASRKRMRSIRSYLEGRGLSDLTALHAPAGLDIGARRPEEIALSILAEVVATRRAMNKFEWTGAASSAEAESEPAAAIDPVCGMTVPISAAALSFEHSGELFYFCCGGCRERFVAEPERYRPTGSSTTG